MEGKEHGTTHNGYDVGAQTLYSSVEFSRISRLNVMGVFSKAEMHLYLGSLEELLLFLVR